VYKNNSKIATKNKPKMASKSQNNTFKKLRNQADRKSASVSRTATATSTHQSVWQ